MPEIYAHRCPTLIEGGWQSGTCAPVPARSKPMRRSTPPSACPLLGRDATSQAGPPPCTPAGGVGDARPTDWSTQVLNTCYVSW